MTRRTSLPGANLLFSSGAATGRPPTATANEKISAYLSPAQLAAIDEYRVGLQRERGVRVDRSRVLRELIRVGLDGRPLLDRLLTEEES